MKRTSILTLIICLLAGTYTFSQELNLNISVLAPAKKTADPTLYKKLEAEIQKLMNTSQWTEVQYENYERIEGNLQLTIKEELSATTFLAEISIQTSRPVYGSTYTTPIIRIIDKNVSFAYDGLKPLYKSDNGYNDNLSSILSFYAYMILGMDGDSFELEGGSDNFVKAQEVYNNLPSNIKRSDLGWLEQSKKRNNRYFFLENALNPKLKEYRVAVYDYHREGLDKMYLDNARSRAVMLSSLSMLNESFQKNDDSYIMKMFADTKRLELIEIFKVADSGQKTKVKDVLIKIDPSKSSLYKELN